MNLDVGCGKDKKAQIGIDIDKKSDADVIGDAHQLPFRNNVFKTVLSHQCLEHIQNPLEAVKEMKRVAIRKVVLRLPSEFHLHAGPQHLYSWNPKTLSNFLHLVFQNVETGYTSRPTRLGIGKPLLQKIFGKMGLLTEIYAICLID